MKPAPPWFPVDNDPNRPRGWFVRRFNDYGSDQAHHKAEIWLNDNNGKFSFKGIAATKHSVVITGVWL